MQVIACLEVFRQHASIGVRHLAMLRTEMGFPETRPPEIQLLRTPQSAALSALIASLITRMIR